MLLSQGSDGPGMAGDSPSLSPRRSEPPAWTHGLLSLFPLFPLCPSPASVSPLSLSVPSLPQCPLSPTQYPPLLPVFPSSASVSPRSASVSPPACQAGFGAFQRALAGQERPSLRGSGNTGRGNGLSCACIPAWLRILLLEAEECRMRAHPPGKMLLGEGCRDAGCEPTPPRGRCSGLGQRRHRPWGGSRDPHPHPCSSQPFCRGRDAPANPLRLRPGAAGEAGPASAHPPSLPPNRCPPAPSPPGLGGGLGAPRSRQRPPPLPPGPARERSLII